MVFSLLFAHSVHFVQYRRSKVTVDLQDEDTMLARLQDSESLADFGLVDSEDTDCDAGRSYILEFHPEEQDPLFLEEEVMEMDDVPRVYTRLLFVATVNFRPVSTELNIMNHQLSY